MASILQVFGKHLASVWEGYVKFLASMRQSEGQAEQIGTHYLASILKAFGKYLASILQVFDKYLASIWQELAIIWQDRASKW